MDELTGRSRAARATYLLVLKREMSTSQLIEALGYKSPQAIYPLMDALSVAQIPVYQPRPGYWALRREYLKEAVDLLDTDDRMSRVVPGRPIVDLTD